MTSLTLQNLGKVIVPLTLGFSKLF